MKKIQIRQSRRYAENPRDTAVFKASGRHGDLIKKKTKLVLDNVNGIMCAKFQVCNVFRLARRCDTNKHTNTQIHIRVNLRISSTGCSPHVDFKNIPKMTQHFLLRCWFCVWLFTSMLMGMSPPPPPVCNLTLR